MPGGRARPFVVDEHTEVGSLVQAYGPDDEAAVVGGLGERAADLLDEGEHALAAFLEPSLGVG